VSSFLYKEELYLGKRSARNNCVWNNEGTTEEVEARVYLYTRGRFVRS
jgi:hypothetical protein